MEHPVVVKPDVISKKASIKCGISPDSQNGNAPMNIMAIQLIPTQTIPSRAKNAVFALRHSIKSSAVTAAIISMLIPKPKTACGSLS
jgi:hypothetical protein